ncbi:periostin isoform X1 [Lepisosteus oculatus]|uniref:periostin isoform X1 n=1 Tax=Lepisosteus oculatus TaxID=7918 RepID=UPI00074022D2|nr:PREDICTED: periostin isoform X1 [Lepisosteus oculatus]
MKLLTVAAVTIFVLSAFDQADSSAYDKIVTHSRIRAKNEGPNVCALQQVMGTKKKYFSTCRNWYQGAICGKKATVLYECCPGYMKLDGMRGCPAVAPIDNVYGTLGLVNAITTQDYSDRSKLREEIEGHGSYTFFAPSNEAWDLLDPEVRSGLVSNVNIELYNALHYHMVNKRLLTKDLKNGMTVESMYDKQGLLINHYSNGVVTVNCARVIHGNQIATNGVVHVIDRVITGVGNTIQDVIEVDDDLTSLSAATVASGLLDKLGEPGHYTVFAPTNEAFEKLPRAVLERIMSDKVALQALLKFHILDSVQCSEAIMAGSSYETLEGNNIEIGCDGESLTVNGIKMVKRKDVVTSNGVIHFIDQVLIPNSAKQVLELTGPSQSTFTDMIAQLGLAGSFRPEAEYTLLAPLNGAFTDEVLAMDQRRLKIILQNHILKLKVGLSQLYNGQLLETLGGKILRVFIYRTAVCIENSCMVRGSKEGRNGAIHLFREIITPAEKSMFEILKSDARFSMFLQLMDVAGLTEVLKQKGDWTLFAPTNDAFEGLTQKEIEILTSDPNALKTILLYHLSNGVFIGGGMESGVTNLLKSMAGSNLMVKAINNTILVNEVKADKSDVMATNGVVHIVKSLLYPRDIPVGNQQLLTILKRLIKHIQLKFIQGYRYQEIPLTFLTKIIKTEVREPEIKIIGGGTQTVTRVIQGDSMLKDQEYRYHAATGRNSYHVLKGPQITKITRVVDGQPSITKVTRVIEGEPAITKVTRVIEGDPALTKVTRVIEGDPTLTKVTRVIEGPQYAVTHVSTDGQHEIDGEIKKILSEEATKVTKLLESEAHLLEEEEIKRLLQGAGTGYTKVTKVIQGEPQVIEGPFSQYHTTIEGEPQQLESDSEKVTTFIQGTVRNPSRRIPTAPRRRTRLAQHKRIPRQ